jgi:hypothetical protein
MKNKLIIWFIWCMVPMYAMEDQNRRNAALLKAAWEGKIGLVRILIQNGADVNACDLRRKGTTGEPTHRTPIMLALMNDHREICTLLLEAGADMTLRDADDRTALRWAQGICRPQIYEMFKVHQEIINWDIFTILLCLTRMKNEGDQCARLLVREFRTLLQPHLPKYATIKSLLRSNPEWKQRQDEEEARRRAAKCIIQ